MKNAGFALFSAAVAFAGALSARASFPVPDWVDEPYVTRDVFDFADNANPAFSAPALSLNPHGEAVASIVKNEWGEGWFDPSWTITLTRDGETGIWDIGRYAVNTMDEPLGEWTGYVDVTVPFASTDVSEPFQLTIFVDLIGYVALSQLPHLEVGGQVLAPARDDLLNQADPPFGGWYHRVWEFDLTVTSGRTASFRVIGDINSSSIDRIAVYSIPEPNSLLFGALLIGPVLLRGIRRKTQRG